MKLKSLHIENFGGLSRFDLEFDDGLTVIHKPNGFGKTTLAEFIRAMFYGFPRRGKTLEKSRRQKYTPWNGGRYGGNLIFTLEGKTYRLERTFGATPKGDTFTLIDLDTNKKSDRFSDQIGLELFKLDAESFERSTYMPQLRDQEGLTTDAIQAKLGNLVEDPGDMGSFDKAMTALKAARSGYIPYRGNGGIVAEARYRVSQLQSQVEAAEGKRHRLNQLREELTRLEEAWEKTKSAREQVYGKLLLASEATALEAAHESYRRLCEEETGAGADVKALEKKYPAGLPDRASLARARDAAEALPLLKEKAEPTEKEREAAEFLEKNRAFLRGNIPETEELENCRRQIGRFHALKTEAENLGLTSGEQVDYDRLRIPAGEGKLEESRLKELQEKEAHRAGLCHALAAAQLPEAERVRLDALRRFFEGGIPGEKDLERHKNALAEAKALRQENARRVQSLSAAPEKGSSSAGAVALGILSVLCLAAGGGLLIYDWLAHGIIALGMGAVALMVALVLGISAARKEKEEKLRRQALRSAMADGEKRIRELEDAVSKFVRPYCSDKDAAEALYEIRDNRAELMDLAAREKAAAAKQAEIKIQLEDCTRELIGELGGGEFGALLMELRLDQARFRNLQKEQTLAEEKLRKIRAEQEKLKTQIHGLLDTYFPEGEPEEFDALLTRLQRICDAWLNAEAQVEGWIRRREAQEGKLAAAEAVLDAFFRKYALAPREDLPEQLLAIGEDVRGYEEACRRMEKASQSKEDYRKLHEAELARTVPEQREDPAELRSRELELSNRENALAEEILSQKQRRSLLVQELEELARLRDELEDWQEKWEKGKENARILDDTMVFLETARENLQNSYLGPVRESFAGYMAELMEEDPRRILLTPDLEVSLERSGQARELGYFSAGQADTVMLCMRLALVDALFTEVSPLLILDDPFINLDDERTRQALKLLETIAQKKQILYLSCNSSRI